MGSRLRQEVNLDNRSQRYSVPVTQILLQVPMIRLRHRLIRLRHRLIRLRHQLTRLLHQLIRLLHQLIRLHLLFLQHLSNLLSNLLLKLLLMTFGNPSLFPILNKTRVSFWEITNDLRVSVDHLEHGVFALEKNLYSKLVDLIFLIIRNYLSRSCFKGGVWKSETVSIWKLNLTASSMLG